MRRGDGASSSRARPRPPAEPTPASRSLFPAASHPPWRVVPPPQVLYLKGLRYIYQFNVFLYMFLSIAGISLLWMVVKGAGGPWRRKKAGAAREGGTRAGPGGSPGGGVLCVDWRWALPRVTCMCSTLRRPYPLPPSVLCAPTPPHPTLCRGRVQGVTPAPP